jgi:hypothetical protein
MGTASFPRIESGQGVRLTPYPLLVPRFKKQIMAIPLLSLRAFVVCKNDETYLHKVARLYTYSEYRNYLS